MRALSRPARSAGFLRQVAEGEIERDIIYYTDWQSEEKNAVSAYQ